MAVINRVRVGIPSTQRATCCSIPTYTRKKPLQTTLSFSLRSTLFQLLLPLYPSLSRSLLLSVSLIISLVDFFSRLFVHFCFLSVFVLSTSLPRDIPFRETNKKAGGKIKGKKIIRHNKDSNLRNCFGNRRVE